VWQVQKPMIDVAEQGRKPHKDRANAEYTHRPLFLFPDRTSLAISPNRADMIQPGGHRLNTGLIEGMPNKV
jgi:hypothetical protein